MTERECIATHILAVNSSHVAKTWMEAILTGGRKYVRNDSSIVYFKSIVLSEDGKNIRCQEFLIFILKPRKIFESYYRERGS